MTTTQNARPRGDDREAGGEQVGRTYEQGNDGRTLRKALRYIAADWPVFPTHWTAHTGCSCGDAECPSPGKHPLTWRGLHDASTDPDVITAWWTRWPAANVAIATGAPGPDVVDFDIKNDAPGAASLAKLRELGVLRGAHTLITTWSGGWHLYYLGSDQGNGTVRKHGVDFRARGGYVLAPPSQINGREYRLTERRSWRHPSVTGINFSLIRRALDPPTAPRQRHRDDHPAGNHDALIRHVASQGEGNRNGALFWAACKAAEGAAGDDVFDQLLAAARSIGLTDREATATIRSARRRRGAPA